MRRALYLVLLLITVTISPVYSQQLSVKSFRGLPNDMDARQNFCETDQNGELCAIVKVVTPESGFQFEIGSLGITKTEQKTGEIWLYIPHGAKRLSIFHKNLGVLRDYFFPERIDEGVCYELVLVSGRTVTTVVANEIESQWLIITSEPTGADVFINDEPAGVTPYQNLLPVGKYNYRLQKTLYLNSAGVVELVSGAQKQKINAKLEPNFGTIEVTSFPERGASVLLDGVETGKTTPCTFERLPVGEHTLTVSLEMYVTLTQKVAVKSGLPQTVNIVMRPAFAEVAVKSTPKGDIYINNALKGSGEWKGRLIPGLYNFEARLDKHISATEQRTVVIGQPLELTLQPIPRTGSLNIMSNPIEATIRISGKDYGTTPNTIKNLLIGDYTVELSLPGYATAFEKVSITEGATSTINATLQNGREVTISSTPVGIDLNFKSFQETVNGVSFDMVAIEGGSFIMGSNDGSHYEKPIHRVTVSDFYMGKTEVTQALWMAVMGNNPSYFKGDNLPVENVSWDDVQEFIKRLNRLTGKKYRLPTEAEWEYAAGGGSENRTKWTGTDIEYMVGNYAWIKSNAGSQTHEVASKFSNSLGLFDMTGNVWEWCSEWYSDYSATDQNNPTGAIFGSFRVLRGISWLNDLSSSKVTFRSGNKPDYCGNSLGFRLSLVP
ncbi:MAG TPA: SUMF1/EgtB/PvdO family nonheme iron enzyme [Desulfosporosinus sp.]|nr:SUMF1/EgtB/PvdO family nonheme iron enzyme [Desulfosporosinus sp.]